MDDYEEICEKEMKKEEKLVTKILSDKIYEKSKSICVPKIISLKKK
jgi:hypothetical protein